MGRFQDWFILVWAVHVRNYLKAHIRTLAKTIR